MSNDLPQINRKDGAEESLQKILKLDKASLLADLGLGISAIQKQNPRLATDTSSEAETEIDIESVPKLLAENVAIVYGKDDIDQKKALDKKTEQKSVDNKVRETRILLCLSSRV